ncbi:pyridoxamine 5'-phosphate oxidase family protein [Mesorhizobium xinjiangense]|uniref:pyridoxamine 5'-phosphate oxidase family protein n=1 Tax=Mesorhizobium xinjiangense TaxID=2678685 RepID=UPI0012ED0331|nr:pyridoxamine 5'-phosphate oxidase family protein [Mesorhizobium xinjiangense]
MEFVSSQEELRRIYKAPGERAVQKELRAIDPHSRNFIARSPFVLIGSQDAEGNADVTPKGDKPGFVAVLDDHTIAIPDRPGNNRLDTLENILVNPAVGLIFFVPGMNETLRINGEARITADDTMRERFAVDEKQPLSVIVVRVRAVYMHCAKSFLRSQLWNPESWPPRSAMPTLGEILKDQIELAGTAADTDRALEEAYRKTLW